MITGLDHISIAVEDLDGSVRLWQAVAQAQVVGRERVPEQQVEVVMLKIGALKIELIYPTSENSSVAKFLASRGPGLHHIALECESAQAELDRLRQAGVQLIDESARAGAEHSHVGFVHPKSLSGVLVEFVDHAG
jgi:methylmalonyl-CoA/ethylmalonyl-CoA epimerase